MNRDSSVLIGAMLIALLVSDAAFAQGAGGGNGGTPSKPAQGESAEPQARPNLLPSVRPPSRSESARPSPAQRAECVWLGKRTITVLLRDDLIASKGFLEIYTNLGCPIQHIGRALGCSVPAAGQSQASEVKAWVDACWTNPEIKPLGTAEESKSSPSPAPSQPRSEPAQRR